MKLATPLIALSISYTVLISLSKVVSSLIYYTFNLFKFQSSNLMVLEVQRLASETTQQSLLKEIQRTNNLGMHYQSKITCMKNLTVYFVELY